MIQFRKSESSDQGLLSSQSQCDWLPSGHLAWFIHDAVDALESDKLREGNDPCTNGKLPCPPRVLLRLMIYAYCTGTFASRRIAASIEVSIALRVLAAGHAPDHRTISRFRDENLDEFHGLFMQVVEAAREARLVEMGTIVVDDSLENSKAMSEDGRLVEGLRLRQEIAKLTRAAQEQDELDDASLTPAAATRRRSDARVAARRSQ